MCAVYTLKILTDFASAHILRGYPGDCSRMHGHNWKVEVNVTATQLNEYGMAMDFKTIKAATRKVAKKLDHRYLNEITPFDKINPTAENIAQYFYQSLATMLNTDTTKIASVTLWETDRACVCYSEDN